MNEYLKEFELVVPDWRSDWLRRKLSGYHERSRLVTHYAWAVPTDEAIQSIAALSPLVEIGAGTGYWAMLLAQAGADIVAYDLAPPGGTTVNQYRHKHTWFDVRTGGPDRAGWHPDRSLFLCWPPYDDPMAYQCLEVFSGQRLAYIGEHGGGCNADDAFFELLHSEWECEQSVDIPQYYGIHDYLSLWRRKGGDAQ